MKKLLFLLGTALPLFAQAVSTNHFDTLKQSTWFAVRGGFANSLTHEGHAVVALCKETNAVVTFQRLLQEPAPAQQLYGLLGLHLLDAPEFKARQAALLNSKARVKTLIGCIAGEREVSELARRTTQWTLRDVPGPGGKHETTLVER